MTSGGDPDETQPAPYLSCLLYSKWFTVMTSITTHFWSLGEDQVKSSNEDLSKHQAGKSFHDTVREIKYLKKKKKTVYAFLTLPSS